MKDIFGGKREPTRDPSEVSLGWGSDQDGKIPQVQDINIIIQETILSVSVSSIFKIFFFFFFQNSKDYIFCGSAVHWAMT